MRPIALALMIAALSAGPAFADDAPPLCKALRGLAEAARGTGQPLRISLDAAQACHATPENDATRAFCVPASTATGFSWRLYDCVNTMAAQPQVTTTGEHAEGRTRKKVTRLTAALAHGVRLDLTASADQHEIVVWAPK
jgi:hypothetical protein